LGQAAEAETTLRSLLDAANRPSEREPGEPADAVRERRSARPRAAMAHYIAGLAHLGLGDSAPAQQEFQLVLQTCPDHLGAKAALAPLQ
jgi:hypothetical protein